MRVKMSPSHITLKGLKEKKLPEIDENFIKNFDKYDSLDSLKSEIRKSLEEEATGKASHPLKTAVLINCWKKMNLKSPRHFCRKANLLYDGGYAKTYGVRGMNSKDATELSRKCMISLKMKRRKSLNLCFC